MPWVNVDFSRGLRKALKRDDLDDLQRRLDAGLDPNSVDLADGYSLLGMAAKAGSSKIVEELLSRGSIPEIGEKGALVAAIESDQTEVVQRLLEAGASIGAGVTYHDEVYLPVVAAPSYAGLEVMRQIYSAEGIEQVDLIWLGEALEAALDRRGVGHLQIIAESLVPRIVGEGATKLEAATLKRSAKKVQTASKRRKDEAKRTRLESLAQALRRAIDREELEYSETLDLVCEERWETLRERLAGASQERSAMVAGLQLVLSVSYEANAYAKELLAKNPDPSIRDQNSTTALMWAARLGDVGLIERLLALGADPRARQDERPFKSVIDWARAGGHAEAIDLLTQHLGLDKAADEELGQLEGEAWREKANELAAMAASEGRWHRVEALLESGAAIDSRGDEGRTMIMLAMLKGDQDRVCWLAERGADLEATCARGRALDSYARQSDSNRPHRESVFGRREPETWMVDLIEELQSRS